MGLVCVLPFVGLLALGAAAWLFAARPEPGDGPVESWLGSLGVTLAPVFAFFGLGDRSPRRVLAVVLAVTGGVGLLLSVLAHVHFGGIPLWFFPIALATGGAVGLAAALAVR